MFKIPTQNELEKKQKELANYNQAEAFESSKRKRLDEDSIDLNDATIVHNPAPVKPQIDKQTAPLLTNKINPVIIAPPAQKRAQSTILVNTNQARHFHQ